MNDKPIIGILMGDAAGVGPEIVAKLVSQNFFDAYCRPIIIGDARIFARACEITGIKNTVCVTDSISQINWENSIYPLLDQKNLDPAEVPFGRLSTKSGKACLDMLKLAVELSKNKKIEGFCFVPLNKAAMKDAGCKFESEHHYMAHLFNCTGSFGEINVVGNLWTTRTTSHIPIRDVSNELTIGKIVGATQLCNSALKNSGIQQPRIALCALNPHCGENGRCGREEIDIITPAIELVQKSGIDATGPYSSDITFIKAFNGEFDGVVTMYHDQGQIALKLKGFDQGITIAGGMPVPVATCAHGTAYDIAGTGIVKTTAFENAVKMVSKMATHMKK